MKISTVILTGFVKIAISQEERRPTGLSFDDYQYDAQSVFTNEFESPQFTSGGFSDLVSDLDYAINEEVDFDENASIFSTAPFTVNNLLTTTSEPRTLPALEITTTLAEMFQPVDFDLTTTKSAASSTSSTTTSTTTSTSTTSTTTTTTSTTSSTTTTSTTRRASASTTSTSTTTSTSASKTSTATTTTESTSTTSTSTTSTTSTTSFFQPIRESFLESSNTEASREFSNREVASLGNQGGLRGGGGPANLPQCNVCSGSGSSSAATYSSCMSSRANGDVTICRNGEICGVEVRMRGGQVTQMSIRCMEEIQCLKNMSQNFLGSPWRASCRPEPQLQSGRFGQSICNGCLKACGNGETCFDPTQAFARAAGGTFTLDSLTRDDWTQGLSEIQA